MLWLNVRQFKVGTAFPFLSAAELPRLFSGIHSLHCCFVVRLIQFHLIHTLVE